jgi:histone H3/H4
MLPLAAIERIARKAGAERISKEALEELKHTIEEITEELVKEIERLARHAKRKTIKEEDVKLAAGKL